MINIPTRRAVEEFLNRFSAAIDLNLVYWVPRHDKFIQGLIDLGITQKLALEIIKQLTPDDYCSGPVPDEHDPSKEVWVFGRDIEGKEAYIKLALASGHRKRKGIVYGKVWSFHEAEHSMKYPLRGMP